MNSYRKRFILFGTPFVAIAVLSAWGLATAGGPGMLAKDGGIKQNNAIDTDQFIEGNNSLDDYVVEVQSSEVTKYSVRRDLIKINADIKRLGYLVRRLERATGRVERLTDQL